MNTSHSYLSLLVQRLLLSVYWINISWNYQYHEEMEWWNEIRRVKWKAHKRPMTNILFESIVQESKRIFVIILRSPFIWLFVFHFIVPLFHGIGSFRVVSCINQCHNWFVDCTWIVIIIVTIIIIIYIYHHYYIYAYLLWLASNELHIFLLINHIYLSACT